MSVEAEEDVEAEALAVGVVQEEEGVVEDEGGVVAEEGVIPVGVRVQACGWSTSQEKVRTCRY